MSHIPTMGGTALEARAGAGQIVSPECGCCLDESGGDFIGVAAVPGAPVSIGWCRNCLTRNAVPRFVVEAWLFSGSEESIPDQPPPINAFAEWAVGLVVWLDGEYMKFEDVIPRLWKEELEERAKDKS